MGHSILRASLILTLLCSTSWSQTPAKMSYQGVLTDASGAPVADGSHSLVFKLYNVSTGGAALWTETQGTVNTTNGVLSVLLGSVTPIGIAFDAPLWLGIAVDGGGELTPRIELTTSPYSFQAKSVDDDAVTSAKIADGTITSADIADETVASADILDGSITAADVAATEVVKSVNALTDAVTLAGGTNMTITLAGNTLTFDAAVTMGNTLDQAYDQGGGGLGRTITADAGAVDIAGTDGLQVTNGSVLFTGTTGTIPATGAGTRLMWYPAKAALRAGAVTSNQFDDANVGIESTVSGGRNNIGSGQQSAIVGGVGNVASGLQSAVGGGNGNIVTDDNGTIGGGQTNQAGDNAGATTDMTHATVGGGFTNVASSQYATIGGGRNNAASATDATIAGGGGGAGNRATDDYGAVGGGTNNQAGDNAGTTADRAYATVAGGFGNTAGGQSSTVGGGVGNVISNSGTSATIGGGNSNAASGAHATVPGGNSNSAAGTYSFAAGRRAKANHAGAFVWGDQTDADFASTAVDQFLIRATGGVGIGTASPSEKLEVSGGAIIASGFANRGAGTGPALEIGYDGSKSVLQSYDRTATSYVPSSYWASEHTFHIGAAEKARLDASGNLGIGTATPRALLDVVKGTTGTGQILEVGSLSFYKDATPTKAADIGLYPVGGGVTDDLVFSMYDGATWFERMRVTNGGNVGIGTTSPLALFHVVGGDLRVGGPNGLYIRDNAGYNSIFSYAGDHTVFEGAGNVGIGTTAPAAKLHIDSATNSRIRIEDDGTTGFGGTEYYDGVTYNGLMGWDRTNDNLIFLTRNDSSVPKMIIENLGDVGIGTTTPGAALNVVRNGGSSLFLDTYVTSTGTPSQFVGRKAAGSVSAPTAIATADEMAYFGGKGYNGSAFAWGTLIGMGATQNWDGVSNGAKMTFATVANGTTGLQVRMVIDHDGKVSIGVGAPAERLTVNGNIAPDTDNAFTSGTATLRWSDVYAASGTVNTSDRRLKDNIEDSPYGLEEVLDLHPVSYTWKDRPERGKKLGLIAQEVQPVISEVVHVGDDPDQTLGLYYSDLVPVLVKAIQEQQESMQAENATLRSELDETRKMVESLATQVEALQERETMTQSKTSVVDAG